MLLLSVFVLAAYLVTLAFFVIGGKAETSRATAMQREGAVMGFGVEADGSLERLRALGAVPLFTRGRFARVTNVLEGRVDDEETRVFGRCSGAHKQPTRMDESHLRLPRLAGCRPPPRCALYFDVTPAAAACRRSAS